MAAASNLTLLMKVFEQEKELFWRNNASLTEEELQRRWSAETGKFRSILGSAETDEDTSPTTAPLVPPRTLPTSSDPVIKRESLETTVAQNTQRTEDPSKQSIPMSRKRTSDSRKGPSPFSSTGSSVPPLHIKKLGHNDDEPFSNYTINKARRTSHGRFPINIPATEYDNPRDYYTKNDWNLFPSAPRAQRNRSATKPMSLSPTQYNPLSTSPTFSISPTTTAATGSTDPTTLVSGDISRQASHMGNSVCDGLDMLRLKSQASNASSSFESHGQNSQLSFTPNLQVDDDLPFFNDSHLLDYTGGVVPEAPQPSLTVPSFSTTPSSSSTTTPVSTLHRTALADPNLSSRFQPASRTQSTRPLAAKPDTQSPPLSRSVSSEHRMIRVKSADGSVKDKISITKAPYVRPQHEKILCPHCNQRPKGYRGEHELGRHINKAHSMMRTVWMCVDPLPEKTFLSRCKACLRGKRYNAYYNAAAHLRRAHFNPKPKGPKGKTPNEEQTKRGGSSGGEWPSMDVCKMWMQEIREYVPQKSQPYNDDEDDDDDDDEDGRSEENNTLTVPHNPQHAHKASQSLPIAHRNFGTLPNSVPVPPATYSNNMLYPPSLSLSAPASQLSYNDDSLYLAQPTQALAAGDKANILDLSLNTNVNADLPFQMSPFAEDQSFYDGFQNPGF
ncbi:MAG: hypothetical protein Q9166_001786 [cf. Caloplaca sp. 2 TL-2023]